MVIHISYLCDYYEILSQNASVFSWEITQDISLQNALIQEDFNMMVKDCEMFGNRIWTVIGGL
jgi:hypothetical protein